MLGRLANGFIARSFRTNRSDWYVRRLTEQHVSTSAPHGLNFRVLEGAEKDWMHEWLKDHQSIYPWVYFPAEMDSAQRYHHWYPTYWTHDTMVAFVKLARSRVFIHDFEAEITLPPGIAFIYDTFVDPAHRNAGVGRALLDATSAWLRKNEYQALYCHIEDWNRPSIKAFTAAGFEKVATIRYTRVTSFRWWYISGRINTRRGLSQWMARRAEAS